MAIWLKKLLLLITCLSFIGTAKAESPHAPYLGFTPCPSDLTFEALDQAYAFIEKNGNIISHHFDNGVPWQEALDKTQYPKHLREDWKWRLSKTPKQHKIFLSVTPLNFNRDSKSPYWGENSDNLPLPKSWQNKPLNHPNVKKAFLNYTLKAVKTFKPDFLAIGIEANILITHRPDLWDSYLELNKHVYLNVKKQYPDLPIFTTVQYEHLRGIEDTSKKNAHLQIPAVKQLLKHSDYMALSTYRYGDLHPNLPTEDFFDLAFTFMKPIAIAECGAISQTTKVMGITLTSDEKNQDEFIKMILKNAQRHNFKFVINWVPIDFDPLVKKLPKEAREIAKAWVHTGLFTYDGKEKRALTTWQSYLNK